MPFNVELRDPGGGFNVVLASGPSTIVGTLNATLALPGLSAVGSVEVAGALSATLPLPSRTASGVVTVAGALNAALPIPSLSASGQAGVIAVLDAVLPLPSLLAEGISDGPVPVDVATTGGFEHWPAWGPRKRQDAPEEVVEAAEPVEAEAPKRERKKRAKAGQDLLTRLYAAPDVKDEAAEQAAELAAKQAAIAERREAARLRAEQAEIARQQAMAREEEEVAAVLLMMLAAA